MLARIAGGGVVCGMALVVDGCGTPDCVETSTCPEPEDASAMADADGDATQAIDAFEASPPLDGATADADAAELDDTGDGSDATTSADAADGSIDDGGGPTLPDGSDGSNGPPPDSGVCVPTPENCTDGIDNACDGHIDCADQPACAAYECAPPVPNTWIGPVLLWTGGYPAPSVPSCPAGYATAVDAFGGLIAAPDTCPCQCAATGQKCSGTATIYTDEACYDLCATVTLSSNACTAFTCTGGGVDGAWKVTAPVASAGTCTPTVTPSGAPPSWQTTARICAYAGRVDVPGGCTNPTNQCLPKPTAPFGSELCVYQPGVQTACPAPYNASAQPVVVYKSFADGRGCGACTCSPTPTAGSCSGGASLYNGSLCAGAALASTVTCGGYSNSPGSAEANFTLTAGTCSVTKQPQPTGNVTATNAYSVCCM